jgi:hypothetical protein
LMNMLQTLAVTRNRTHANDFWNHVSNQYLPHLSCKQQLKLSSAMLRVCAICGDHELDHKILLQQMNEKQVIPVCSCKAYIKGATGTFCRKNSAKWVRQGRTFFHGAKNSDDSFTCGSIYCLTPLVTFTVENIILNKVMSRFKVLIIHGFSFESVYVRELPFGSPPIS